MAAIQFSFAQVDLSEADALDLADRLFEEQTFAARRAGFKIRQQARRDQRGQLTEQVELTSDEQAALLDMLDATASRTPA
jgi:hypothetical protein